MVTVKLEKPHRKETNHNDSNFPKIKIIRAKRFKIFVFVLNKIFKSALLRSKIKNSDLYE